MIEHECPECGQSIESSDRLAGDEVICPACDASVMVPLLPAEAPTPSPLPPGEDTPPTANLMELKEPERLIPGVFLVPSIFAVVLFKGVIGLMMYSAILGVIALVISATRRNIKKHWLGAFTWLFLIAAIVDLAVYLYWRFLFRLS